MAGDSDDDIWEYKSQKVGGRVKHGSSVLPKKTMYSTDKIPIIAQTSRGSKAKAQGASVVKSKGRSDSKELRSSRLRSMSRNTRDKTPVKGKQLKRKSEELSGKIKPKLSSLCNSSESDRGVNSDEVDEISSDSHEGGSTKNLHDGRKINYSGGRKKVVITSDANHEKKVSRTTSVATSTVKIIPKIIVNSPQDDPEAVPKEKSSGNAAVTPNVAPKSQGSAVVTPNKRVFDGHCPFCQMPFKCLLIESPRWHTTECMDVPIISIKECPDGLSCDNTIPSHYRKYKHSVLADNRAGLPSSHAKQDTTIQELSLERLENNIDSSEPSRLGPSGSKTYNRTLTLPVCQSPYISRNGSPEVRPSNSRRQLFHPLKSDNEDSIKDSVSQTSESRQQSENHRPSQSKKVEVSSDDSESGDDIFFDANDAANSQDKDSELNSQPDEINAGPQASDAKCKNKSEENVPDEEKNLTDVVEIQSDSEDDQVLYAALDTPFDETATTKDKVADCFSVKDQIKESQSPLKKSLSEGDFTRGKLNLKAGCRQMSIQNFFTSKTAPSDSANTSQQNQSVKPSTSLSWKSLFSAVRFTKAPEKEPVKSKPGGFVSNFGQKTTGSNGYRGKKQCPFYKRMPGTPFTVDAFRYGSVDGCKAYFLTHFHYDHYGGLTRKFSHPIYCSKITGNLVKKKIGVDHQFIRTIPLDTPTVVEGVEVTFLEANHCPGSVLILYKLQNGTVILHTGDFRASREMEFYPQLTSVHINQLYLDTTYCDPSYAFPPQKDVIAFSVSKASEIVHQNPDTLVVVGSYTIGKERIFMAIAEDLNCKICVNQDKKNVLDCLEDPSISKRITLSPYEARVHVLPMRQLNYQNLSKYIEGFRPRYSKILAFEPTGWTHSGGTRHIALENLKPKRKQENITIYGVPYSEHSSYTEMKRFCQFLRPDRILATVNNGNPASRKKMDDLFEEWMKEKLQSPQNSMKQSGIKAWFK